MGSVVPGYEQHTVPVPHAGHGQVVQAVDVKNAAHIPWAQTWSAGHAEPQFPTAFEQWRGLEASCATV